MYDIDFVPSPYFTGVWALQNRTKNFGNTTSGLGSAPKNDNYSRSCWRRLNCT